MSGSDEPQGRGVTPARVAAAGLALVGGVAVFAWTLHATRHGVWWQVGVAAVVWAGHAWVVTRLWRAGDS